MRGLNGRLKILDFGLARSAPRPRRAAPRHAPSRTPIGTPGYMAPERMNGQPCDAPSDVFAFGVLMYEYARRASVQRAERVGDGGARAGERRPPTAVARATCPAAWPT